MDELAIERIQKSPKYKELVTKRESFALKLSIAMLVIYYSFVLVIAFMPDLFGIPISGVITLGIPIGLFVIIVSFVLTGIYVQRANSEYDSIIQELHQEFRSKE